MFKRLSRDHKFVSGRIIGILLRYVIEKDPDIKVEAIVATVNKQFQYTVSYEKVWYKKQKALIDIYGE